MRVYDTDYRLKSVKAVAHNFIVGFIPIEGYDNNKNLKACFPVMQLICMMN